MTALRPDDYNVVVLGGGTAGLVTAAAVAALGGKVALVERARMGGDCLNTGCVPSKALLSSARLANRIRRAQEWGIESGPPHIELTRVLDRVRERRAKIAPKDSKARFESLGVAVIEGSARFLSPREVAVGQRRLRAARFVIATGSRPRVPDIPGLTGIPFLTNETVFDVPSRPKRLLVLGGGPIGCELGQAFSRLGSSVVILQRAPQLLEREDDDISACLLERLEAEGVTVHTSARVLHVERLGETVRIGLAGPASNAALDGDAVLLAAGRTPNVEGLDLEAAGVACTEKGITVDATMRTSQKHIYAAGDVVGGLAFTHAADAHARTIARNIVLPAFPARFDGSAVPWCTFTDPEVARVGLSERQARERGIPVDVHSERLEEIDRAVVEGEDAGFAKVLTAKGTDRILGAAIVAERAGDLIAELVLAMRTGIGLGKVSGTVHSYPTSGEIVRRLADKQQRRRLTPFARRLFAGLFRRRLSRLGR